MVHRRHDPDVCGVTAAIAVIEGKWKTTLLWLLESGPHRPAALHREVYDVLPPKTVYSLTAFGRELAEALAPLSDWGHRRLEGLAEASAS